MDIILLYSLEHSRFAFFKRKPISPIFCSFSFHSIHSSHRNRICRKSVLLRSSYYFLLFCSVPFISSSRFSLPLKMMAKPYSHISITVNILRLTTVLVALLRARRTASMWFACANLMARRRIVRATVEHWHGFSSLLPSIQRVSRKSWRNKLAESSHTAERTPRCLDNMIITIERRIVRKEPNVNGMRGHVWSFNTLSSYFRCYRRSCEKRKWCCNTAMGPKKSDILRMEIWQKEWK